MNAFPFESDEYESEFYNGTVLDGWRNGDTSEKFINLDDAIKRAVERSTDDDVWGVYQVGKHYDEDCYREDRIVALVFKQEAYLFRPEPREYKRRPDIFEQVANAPLVKPEGKSHKVDGWDI